MPLTLRDAGREFARLTAGLAVPREHVELMQCVLNNSLGRIFPVAMNVWLSIPVATRDQLDVPLLNRLLELLRFFEHTADAAKTGETPAMSLERHTSTLMADTKDEINIVPLTSAGETKLA